MAAVRSFWGWGYQKDELKISEIKALVRLLGDFVKPETPIKTPPKKDSLNLQEPKIKLPASLLKLADTSNQQRARHCYGRSFKDVVRGLNNEFIDPPDFVLYPKTVKDVIDILDYSSNKDIAVICYGGGSSVVGGVEFDHEMKQNYAGWISMDMTCMDKLNYLDKDSRSASFQAGILGPGLEEKLKPNNFTLRHFPQSFEFSSLGGWIATRAGGHFAMGPTHIDDFVESLEVVTPVGTTVTRRLPASGAASDENRLWLGSEGMLGIVTSAWIRVQPRTRFVAKADVAFDSFKEGISCLKDIAQSGLYPSNCRLLDPVEALINGVYAANKAILLVGFESYDHEVSSSFRRAKEICKSHRGVVVSESVLDNEISRNSNSKQTAGGSWKNSFIKAPYFRDALVRLGLVIETFETAVTWDNFDELYFNISNEINRYLSEKLNGSQWVTCRITHAYPNGLAPYFSVIASCKNNSQTAVWNDIKQIANETIIKFNGTITHHHAVGKEHRDGFKIEKSQLYLDYLKNTKKYFDPKSILNPGNVIRLL